MTSQKVDAVIIGSGIGGLCCAALLAHYGRKVIVCESHTLLGGAAHGFERDGHLFDSGPSLYSGLSYSPSPNPLRQVLDIIGEDIAWANYDTWGCCLPEGDFKAAVGADQFCEVLQKLRGPLEGQSAVTEWRELQRVMAPLAAAAVALPTAAIRFDWGALRTATPFVPSLLKHAVSTPKLAGPFSQIMDSTVRDPFIRNWLNMLCFLLSGLPAEGTSTAEVAFMFADWYRPNVQLDYPMGGSAALVAALARSITKPRGNATGEIRTGAHVTQISSKSGKVTGVRLRNGDNIESNTVISNASVWDMLKLIPEGALPKSFVQKRQSTPTCDSFMHLHLGIEAAGLPEDLACHYIVVNDWDKGITAPQNLVLISIPSVLDPGLAPPGKHTIHVYTPGNEPYGVWRGMDRTSAAYAEQKQARSAVMWQALQRVIPDIRDRTTLALTGTPMTHARYLRRHEGSYGPAIAAGQALFPGPKTPLSGLLCCGDSTFPGIGLPAVAASGMMAAHTLVPVRAHQKTLAAIGAKIRD